MLVDFAVQLCLMNSDSKGECVVVTSMTHQQSFHKSEFNQQYRKSQDLQYQMHHNTSSIVSLFCPYYFFLDYYHMW